MWSPGGQPQCKQLQNAYAPKKEHFTISIGQTHWPEDNNYTKFDKGTQSFATNPTDKKYPCLWVVNALDYT